MTLSTISTESYEAPDPMILESLTALDNHFYEFSEELGRVNFSFQEDVLAKLAPGVRNSWDMQAMKLWFFIADKKQTNGDFNEVYYETLYDVQGHLDYLRERDLPAIIENATQGLLRLNPLTDVYHLSNEKFALWWVRWLNLLGEE